MCAVWDNCIKYNVESHSLSSTVFFASEYGKVVQSCRSWSNLVCLGYVYIDVIECVWCSGSCDWISLGPIRKTLQRNMLRPLNLGGNWSNCIQVLLTPGSKMYSNIWIDSSWTPRVYIQLWLIGDSCSSSCDSTCTYCIHGWQTRISASFSLFPLSCSLALSLLLLRHPLYSLGLYVEDCDVGWRRGASCIMNNAEAEPQAVPVLPLGWLNDS